MIKQLNYANIERKSKVLYPLYLPQCDVEKVNVNRWKARRLAAIIPRNRCRREQARNVLPFRIVVIFLLDMPL